MAAAGSSIELHELTHRFPGARRAAVDRVSLTIEAGEPLVLLGPSGAGKTTLLRLIAGLDRPSARSRGVIRFDGMDVARRSPHERGVAMVFQDRSVYPHLTVRGNLKFGLGRWGLGRREIADRVDEAMERLELSGLADRKPHQISGGERQRLALGRAMVRRPGVLLLDEPLGHLDEPLRWRMREMLRRAVESVGCTTLLVTHDQTDAFAFGHSSRAALMDMGRILQTGRAEELRDRPASLAVARFLGRPPINELTIDLAGSDAGERLAAAFRHAAAEGDRDARLEQAVLCVRPQDVVALPEADGEAAGEESLTLPGISRGREMVGDRAFALVELAPGVIWRAGVGSDGTGGDAEAAESRTDIRISISLDRILLFSAATGDRVHPPPVGPIREFEVAH